MIIEYDRPPHVAATRDSSSLRRNQNNPNPARSGFRTMSRRNAVPQCSVVNSAMADALSHPDWGSDAYGVPASWNGFQRGTWPCARLRPRKQ
jgi:hypothetical protein